MNEHIDKHLNMIPVHTCMHRGCFRQLTKEEGKQGLCNAHQPQPQILEPALDDLEAIVYELQVLTPLGWVTTPVDLIKPGSSTRLILSKQVTASRMYGGMPIHIQQQDTCNCGGWIHPDHWDMGVRECVKCAEKANRERIEKERAEAVAGGLGKANSRIR